MTGKVMKKNKTKIFLENEIDPYTYSVNPSLSKACNENADNNKVGVIEISYKGTPLGNMTIPDTCFSISEGSSAFRINDYLFFTMIYDGIGGFYPYASLQNLYRVNLVNKTGERITGSMTDADYTSDYTEIVYRSIETTDPTDPKALYSVIVVKNLMDLSSESYDFPYSTDSRAFGSFKFSPKEDKVAIGNYLVDFDNINDSTGEIYILGLNTKEYTLYATTEGKPEIIGWNDNETVLFNSFM
jgi:hypothetical protein